MGCEQHLEDFWGFAYGSLGLHAPAQSERPQAGPCRATVSICISRTISVAFYIYIYISISISISISNIIYIS